MEQAIYERFWDDVGDRSITAIVTVRISSSGWPMPGSSLPSAAPEEDVDHEAPWTHPRQVAT
jgi:hypothetical protein